MNAARVSGVRRRPSLRLNKPAGATRPMSATPITATGATQTSTTMYVVTFDQAVRLCAVPQYRIGSAVPASAREVSPTQIELTYPAGAGGGSLVIPFDDAGVSNASGGRVTPATFGLAAEVPRSAAEESPQLKAA